MLQCYENLTFINEISALETKKLSKEICNYIDILSVVSP